MKKRTISSPLGLLEIIADDKCILEICFDADSKHSDDSDLIDRCEKELDEYFKGQRREFTIPTQFTGTEFQNKVWGELTKIPYGKTISYSELAIRLGDLKTIRAVGTANGKNKLPIVVPCHRVIGKDGSLVGFSGGLDKKKWLLQHEGFIKGEQMDLFAH